MRSEIFIHSAFQYFKIYKMLNSLLLMLAPVDFVIFFQNDINLKKKIFSEAALMVISFNYQYDMEISNRSLYLLDASTCAAGNAHFKNEIARDDRSGTLNN